VRGSGGFGWKIWAVLCLCAWGVARVPWVGRGSAAVSVTNYSKRLKPEGQALGGPVRQGTGWRAIAGSGMSPGVQQGGCARAAWRVGQPCDSPAQFAPR